MSPLRARASLLAFLQAPNLSAFLVLGLLCLQPVLAVAENYSALDEVVAVESRMDDIEKRVSLACAPDGKLFAAVSLSGSPGKRIRIYRSLNDGDSWSTWGTITPVILGASYVAPVLHIAGGATPRLFLGYIQDSAIGGRTARLAYADPNAAAPTWTTAAPTDLGSTVATLELTSNTFFETDYWLYAVTSNDGGSEIRFACSKSQGASWDASYPLAVAAAGFEYHKPRIVTGSGDVVHVAWTRYGQPIGGPAGTPEGMYQRALNWAAASTDWQSVLLLTSESDAAEDYPSGLVATDTNGNVIITMDHAESGEDIGSTSVHVSFDHGVNWSTDESWTVDHIVYSALALIPEEGGYVMSALDLVTRTFGFRQGSYMNPQWWGPLSQYSDAPVYNGDLSAVTPADLETNPAIGYYFAFLWAMNNTVGTPDSLFFEGAWFNVEGFPRIEEGFPKALSSPPVTHPGVAELDGDMGMEIFFSDSTGYLHVLNHDGTEVSGWPVYVGPVQGGSAVAGGDIDGDGTAELVVGTATGIVRAYDWGGVIEPGYPIDLGTGLPVYVSIGPLWSGPDSWQVVAASGTEVHAFSFGSEMPGFPLIKPSPIVGPAAIGDLDMEDGYAEIVTALTDAVHVDRHDGSSLLVRSFASDPPVGPVAIADLDIDQALDREIAISCSTGKVFLIHHTGEDCAGWPRTFGGVPLTATLANVFGYGFTRPQVVVPLVDGRVYLLWDDGSIANRWPMWTTPGSGLVAPATAEMLGNPGILISTPGDSAYAWETEGATEVGWPIGLGEPSILSPASWDLDNDGSLEVVFLTHSAITVLDLNASPPADRTFHWPMYGCNPERMFCLDFWQPVATGVGGDSPLAARGLMPPAPNPMTRASRIAFALEPGWSASVEVLDLAGRLVRTLARGVAESGSLIWDGLDERGRRAPAGIYMVRLTERNGKESRSSAQKLVVVR